MRVLQIRGDLNFLQEPLCAECFRELRPEHLECDLPVVLEVLREIYGGHPTFAEWLFKPISVG